MIVTSPGLPWKYSAIFGNFRKMFGNVRLAFETILQNPRKSSESGRKSWQKCRKRLHEYLCMIKRKLHVSPTIWILCSRGKNNISPVRYCSCHSSIKFKSSRHRVISFIYLSAKSFGQNICHETHESIKHKWVNLWHLANYRSEFTETTARSSPQKCRSKGLWESPLLYIRLFL